MKLNNLKITTDRLLFRPLTIDDANFLFEYRSNPSVSEFQNWVPSQVEDAIHFIKKNESTEMDTPDSWLQLAIAEKESSQIIGDFGIHFLEAENPQCEIGFSIAPKFQNIGYGTEAVAGVLRVLFADLKKHRVFASVDPNNLASSRVLEKARLRKEAHFRKSLLFKGRWTDDVIYAALRDEWIKNSGCA
ncbi:MAG: GNAT family protein [Proteobacteria bacterium]|nr:GNAT family protein [Pseudomonadota bacterium]